MTDEEQTRPGVQISAVRRQRISSQSELDAVAVLLGELEAAEDYDTQRAVAKAALHRSFERGRAAERVDAAQLGEDHARERHLRITSEQRRLDARMALLRYERTEHPEAWTDLRKALLPETADLG